MDAIRSAIGMDLVVQIAREGEGRYALACQREIVRGVKPEAVSIAFRELVPDPSEEKACRSSRLDEARDSGPSDHRRRCGRRRTSRGVAQARTRAFRAYICAIRLGRYTDAHATVANRLSLSRRHRMETRYRM